ncbi:MAG: DUF6152 family protein [Gammaproteobacteria bacterium]
MRFTTASVALSLFAVQATAHHSEAGIDMQNVLSFDATVTEYSWRNPHVYFTAETVDDAGASVEWTLQMGSTITSTRTGWSSDSLTPGDRVTIHVHPAMDGRSYGILESVDLAGGGAVVSGVARYEVEDQELSATSLEGKWMADPAKLVRYPGGFDGFFRAQLQPTEAGRAAMESYNTLSDDNPDSTCVPRPTPALIVSSNLYPIEIVINEADETILLRTESFDEERVVYLDGRSHPPVDDRTAAGHSIGRWEGDVLVIDTANFADNRSPYQIGVPGGAQRHVVERYELIDGGRRVRADFTLEDPEYLAEPLTHSRELLYSPHLPTMRFDCDPNVTRRFVP